MWQLRVELNIIPLRISIALPSSKQISHVRFLVLLPLLVFLLHEASIFFDMATWYPQMLKTNVGLQCCSCRCHLELPTISRIMCLSSMVRDNDDHPAMAPADPCDATIGNEFPESDVTHHWFEMLHFDAELERTHN